MAFAIWLFKLYVYEEAWPKGWREDLKWLGAEAPFGQQGELTAKDYTAMKTEENGENRVSRV